MNDLSEMKLAPLSLSFTGEYAHLERPFIDFHSRNTLKQARYAGLIALVLYAVFGVADAYWVPEKKHMLWFIRYCLACPIFLSTYLFTYSRHFKASFLQPVISAMIIVAGGSIVAMMVVVAPRLFSPGLILVIFVNFTAIGARFRWATFSAFIMSIFYNIAATFFLDSSLDLLVVTNVLAFSFVAIGMFACYSMEYRQRANFFLSHLLRREQEKVMAANRGLEKRIREATAELAESNKNLLHEMEEHKSSEEKRAKLELELRHAQHMKALGTLAGGVAHDFNNLLMGIQGRASLIMINSAPGHPHYENAKGIEKLVKSAAGLTRQLLSLAQGGKHEAKASHLNALMEKMAQMFGRTHKEVDIRLSLASDLWVVDVDRTQIEQVLLNLFVNAWQAMPPGVGGITVVTQNRTLAGAGEELPPLPPGEYVVASVIDTGSGMDAEILPKIFDPFFTTKEMGRGSGLGLASAYGIIKNHGGAITVSSQKGRGSRFDIWLPRSHKEVEPEKDQPRDLAPGSGLVLVIDDEESALQACKEFLEALGYTAVCTQNPMEALEIFQQRGPEFQAVVLDMIMPQMSGPDLYAKLKELHPPCRILLCSGYSRDGDAARLLAAGTDGFIQKPYSIQQLSHKIKKLTDRTAT